MPSGNFDTAEIDMSLMKSQMHEDKSKNEKNIKDRRKQTEPLENRPASRWDSAMPVSSEMKLHQELQENAAKMIEKRRATNPKVGD